MQLGEPLLDPKDPQAVAKLRAMRALNLQRREFPGEGLPLDVALPPQPNTRSEEEFLRTFPVVPDFTIDRDQSTSFTPTVPKERRPALDAPGEFRRRAYQDRMIDELRAR
jgi:hypothetical protein